MVVTGFLCCVWWTDDSLLKHAVDQLLFYWANYTVKHHITDCLVAFSCVLQRNPKSSVAHEIQSV